MRQRRSQELTDAISIRQTEGSFTPDALRQCCSNQVRRIK